MMAGHTKSSSHGHSMFGFGQYICRAYSCFQPDKNRSPSNKRKSITNSKSRDTFKSFNESCKDLSERNEPRRSTNDMMYVLRSQKGNEFQIHDNSVYSPRLSNSNNLIFSRSSSPLLFRSASQTIQTPTKSRIRLTRSLTKERDNTKKTDNVGTLKRSSSSNKLETKSLGRGMTTAYSGSLSRSGSSRKGSTEIMHLEGLVKLLTIEERLECTLEELCFGCVKRITVDRNAVTYTGQILKETETLSIKVKPGWTKGTKIAFEGVKNEEKGTYSCDVNFVITEKKHKLYRREGDDLEFGVRISLIEALAGCTLSIPLLGGEKMELMLDEIIVPGYETIIKGQGMRKSKEQKHRGNLRVTFLVDFPTELTEDQKKDIADILQDSF